MAQPLYQNSQLTPELRTLAWCLSSPSLISMELPSEVPQAQALSSLLKQIEIPETIGSTEFAAFTPKAGQSEHSLHDWLDSRGSRRLGHLFEHYWHFYWKHTLTQPYLVNQQVNQDGVTLGELDMVRYEEPTRTLHHYELAIKFYLQYPCNDGKHLWIGPNRKDRLDLKLTQMLTRQLTLIERSKPSLPLDWQWQSLKKHLIVKGWLFYPLATDTVNTNRQTINCETLKTWCDEATPVEGVISQAHLRGHWLKTQDLQQLPEHPYWLILDRQQWLGWNIIHPQSSQSSSHSGWPEQILTQQQLMNALQDPLRPNDAPIMFAAMKAHRQTPALPSKNRAKDCSTEPDTNQPYLEECQRFILVRDNWPT